MTSREHLLWSVLKWLMVTVCLVNIPWGIYRYNNGRVGDAIAGIVFGAVGAVVVWTYLSRIQRRSPPDPPLPT
jgi:hypothetical protein